MFFFAHVEPTDVDASLNEKINLDVLQRALEARIRLSTESAEVALKQALHSPSLRALDAADRAIDVLQSMRVDAMCIKNLGRTDTYLRLNAILDNITSTRAMLAKTATTPASIAPPSTPSHIESSPTYSLPQQLYNL